MEQRLESLGETVDEVVAAMPPEAKSFLSGEWLGHPLHPVLTDLPIGFWTSAWVLDIVGGRRSRRVATTLVGFGVASAAPTIASGMVEFSKLEGKKRETAVIHMVANGIATLFYTWSFFARLRGRRGRGVALGMLGATAATVGGYLGGQLAFGKNEDELGEVRANATVAGGDDAELHVVGM